MSKSAAAKAGAAGERLVAENRKARFQYEIVDRFEAGLVLRGTEVKVLRAGKLSLDEAYARVVDGELWLIGANIPEYSHGNQQNHEPKRKRKCLVHRRELRKLKARSEQQGLTLVPLRVYFNDKGLAKVTIAVARGRNVHDKRAHLKERAARAEMRDG